MSDAHSQQQRTTLLTVEQLVNQHKVALDRFFVQLSEIRARDRDETV